MSKAHTLGPEHKDLSGSIAARSSGGRCVTPVMTS